MTAARPDSRHPAIRYAGNTSVAVCVLLAACAPDARTRHTAREPGLDAQTDAQTDARADRAARAVATFSIVGFDPQTGDLGIAVQSKFFGVGAVVPWARAGVGAVATQSYANTTYGPAGLDLLAAGHGPDDAIARLTGDDDGRAERQVGVVDATGRAATFTGDACLPWAGGRTGDNFAAQGNILAGPEVVDAMAIAFEHTPGDLATRLVAALAAGQAAGGDVRGRQSAAVLVVRDGGGYGGFNDRYIDLRVDDHAAPIRELRRLLDMRHGEVAGEAAGQALDARDLEEALTQAENATRLSPADGFQWMTLAAVHIARGESEAAAAAAREALSRDPWIKQAMLQGLDGGDMRSTLEALLAIESFARFWESIPG